MKYEMSQLKRTKTRNLKDPRLSVAEKKDLAKEYNTKLEQMQKDLSRYIKESRVHPNLYHEGGLVQPDFSRLSANLDKLSDAQREKHLRHMHIKNPDLFNYLLEYLKNQKSPFRERNA